MKKNFKKNKLKFIQYLFLLLFTIMLIIGIINWFQIYKNKNSQDKIIDNLKEIGKVNFTSESNQLSSIDFNILQHINDNIVGWIVIENTHIDYPVVQGNDNLFYLNHSYDKSRNPYGTIFIDFNSSPNFSDKNTFIYGHHTQDGSMFGDIEKYKDEKFYQTHRYFYLYTPNKIYQVMIFSFYMDDALSNSYNKDFINSLEFENYISTVKKKSIYPISIDVDAETDKIISLYSCSSNTLESRDRYFLHGKLVEYSTNKTE